MRCRLCNYALWNLTTRQCPECGSAFKPSDFDFTPGSVRFHCPHCNKAYYGTDGRGHLVPRSFNCVGCGRPVDMDDTVLSPAHGVSEEQTAPSELPWAARARNGPIRSFLRMCYWAMGRPGEMGRTIPVAGGSGSAFWFMLLVQLVTWTILMASIMLLPALLLPAPGRASFLFGAGMGVVGIVAATVFILVPLWALLSHAILAGTGKTHGGLGLTFSSLCYAAGASAPTAIPFIGYMIGPIWWLISATVTVKESQRVNGGRAALAVLTLPVICMVLVVGLYVWVISTAIGTARTAAMTAAASAQNAAVAATDMTKTQSVTLELVHAMTSAAGAGVDPLELVADGRIQPQMLVSGMGQTAAETWTISGVSLSNVPFLSAEEMEGLRSRLRQAEQSGTISLGTGFRLGDVVFYCDQVDVTTDRGVWLVVMWPDPKTTPVEDPGRTIWVGRVNGMVESFTPETFDAALAGQNQLRTREGLPAIRHPRDVK